MADAGLDQNVTVNATVYLDATGSRDPDGEIDGYEWRLETPDGNYEHPDCQTCGRTSFVAREIGTYNATVTVTDDDGTTSSDTLRVHVEEADGPTVTLSGPEELNTGEVAGYTASVSAGSADVAAVTWRIDGDWQNRTSIAGESATADFLHAFTAAGSYTVSVTAVDRLGRQRTATKEVTVNGPDADISSESGSPAEVSGTGDGESCSQYNRDDATYCNNDRMTLDSNGIVISDADNDGTTEWGGQTLDADFAAKNEGVSFDSTDGTVEFDSQEAYKEALEAETVNVNPTADANQDTDQEDTGDSEDRNNGGPFSDDSDNTDGNSEDDESSDGGDDGSDDANNGDDNDGGTSDTNKNANGEDSEEGETEGSDNSRNRTGRVPHNGPGGF
ncbi:PKD domain-containing protein [Halosimplex sp. TS25]|uniref:PKD domain-containing protein n=1 Tax=Halosimplex rarum TaxID=3396619 RepID=UPI0039ED17C0